MSKRSIFFTIKVRCKIHLAWNFNRTRVSLRVVTFLDVVSYCFSIHLLLANGQNRSDVRFKKVVLKRDGEERYFLNRYLSMVGNVNKIWKYRELRDVYTRKYARFANKRVSQYGILMILFSFIYSKLIYILYKETKSYF